MLNDYDADMLKNAVRHTGEDGIPNTTPGKENFSQSQIDEIMDWFDFGKVARAMDALDWTWVDAVDGVPLEPEIRKKARTLLTDLRYSRNLGLAGGGFIATHEDGDPLLVFALDQWEAKA